MIGYGLGNVSPCRGGTELTRAAKRAYVTQQCLSAHIKKLEIRMGRPFLNESLTWR